GGLSYDTRFEGYPLDDLLGRVAVNPDCFTSLDFSDPHGGTCRYLDSQADIESNVGRGAIVRTDVTVTCPLVSLRGKAVAPRARRWCDRRCSRSRWRCSRPSRAPRPRPS